MPQQFLIGQRVKNYLNREGTVVSAEKDVGDIEYRVFWDDGRFRTVDHEELTAIDPPPECERCKRLAALVKDAYLEGYFDMDGECESLTNEWSQSDAKRELDKIMGDSK